MTVEEIEILVTVKVEEALKQFMEIAPAIKKEIKKAQEAFSNINTKEMTNKIHQATIIAKKKIQDFKKSIENNKVAIKITNKDAKKQISQLEKEINSLQEKINARELKLNITNNALDKMGGDTRQKVISDMPDAGNKAITQETYKRLDDDTSYKSLIKESDKLNTEIMKYNSLLDSTKSKMNELKSISLPKIKGFTGSIEGLDGTIYKMSNLKQEINQTGVSQNKLTNFFQAFKKQVEQVKPSISSIGKSFNILPKITQSITNKIKQMSSGIKQGIGNILKYAGALFGLRGIYNTLKGSASAWLSSQNAGAQQLSANIEYMKYAMGSVFAPVIETVINLVYKLMKAIQSLVYAFSGVNIFAKATASSMNKTAGSAKQTSKSLAGIHGEINNVSDNKDSGGSGGSISPNMDLSQMDMQINGFSQKLYEFFKPLVDSWNTYGVGLIEQVKTTVSQVGGLISSIWGSFENIITNGTVYSILENILAIIGNIAEAFSNAWNYNGNGDAIIQNLANAFNNLLGAINNVVQSEGFQNFLNNCSDKFKLISEKLESIDWQPLMNALSQIGTSVGTIALDILNGLTDVFKWLVENPIVAEIITAIAIAIGVVSTAMSIWSAVLAILTPIQTALNISLLPLMAIILAIVAVITLIVLAIMNWDTVTKALTDTWNWVCEKAKEIWNAIADFFKNLWQGICDTISNVWNGIKDFFSNIWNTIVETVTKLVVDWINSQIEQFNFIKNTISNVFNAIKDFFARIWNSIKETVLNIINGIKEKISNIITGIKDTISNILNTIKTIWSNIWNGLKTTVTNIFNNIWNSIKSVINSILCGIEGMANGVVNGVNTVIKTLNKLKFDIPDWIPGFGGKTFGFNIGLIPTVSIPRLAKGGVLTQATTVLAGEYAGARSNPEIVAPQNILKETFDEVLTRHEWNNNSNNDRVINLSVYVGNKKIGEILLDELSERKRRNGKGIEAYC